MTKLTMIIVITLLLALIHVMDKEEEINVEEKKGLV